MANKRDSLGEFEQLILLAALQLGESAYGYEIVKIIEARCRRPVSRSSLYVTFDRLEGKGFLESSLADPSPARGGRRKRYVRVTAEGIDALGRSREALFNMWEGLESILGGGA